MAGKSTYNPELADRICAEIAGGSNLSRICGKDGFPTRETVYQWLRANPSFADNYARAREDRGDWRNDQIDQIAEDVRTKELDAQQARVLIDALKWQAAHEAPKRYGDRLELAGDKDSPLVIQAQQKAAALADVLSPEQLEALRVKLLEEGQRK